jgi:hypothetical protein
LVAHLWRRTLAAPARSEGQFSLGYLVRNESKRAIFTARDAVRTHTSTSVGPMPNGCHKPGPYPALVGSVGANDMPAYLSVPPHCREPVVAWRPRPVNSLDRCRKISPRRTACQPNCVRCHEFRTSALRLLTGRRLVGSSTAPQAAARKAGSSEEQAEFPGNVQNQPGYIATLRRSV